MYKRMSENIFAYWINHKTKSAVLFLILNKSFDYYFMLIYFEIEDLFYKLMVRIRESTKYKELYESILYDTWDHFST